MTSFAIPRAAQVDLGAQARSNHGFELGMRFESSVRFGAVWVRNKELEKELEKERI